MTPDMNSDKTPREPLLPASGQEQALPPPESREALPPPPPVEALPPPAARFPARPVHLPEPTYWPFFLAVGLAFIGWGLISAWMITVGGLIVFIISLVGWINILRHEHE